MTTEEIELNKKLKAYNNNNPDFIQNSLLEKESSMMKSNIENKISQIQPQENYDSFMEENI